MTIRAALIVNNYGKPRLTKFYTQLTSARQQALIKQIYRLVCKRPEGVCNFLDAPELTALLPPSQDAVQFSVSNATDKGKQKQTVTSQDELRVIYRHYATLYFVFVVDQSESELGILDLIQVLVESLDRCFENVCELDLIFHFDEVHAILNEVIQGGLVVETNINEIVHAAQTTSRERKTSAASSSSSLTPSSLNLSLPSAASWISSNPTGLSLPTSNIGGLSWPKGTFVVDAISNLGSQYLGGGRGR